MLLWVSVAVMTVVAVVGVLWPLFRKRPARSGSDVLVYRDQLQEIDRDLGLGLIGAKEAEAARIEVSRRLLSATDQGGEVASESGWSFHRTAVAGLALVLLTAGSAALYLRLGTPSLAQTTAAPPQEQTGIDKLVAQAEEYLTRNPQDARGWEVLGPVYMRLGRYAESANAWRNVLQLSGENADRLANLGEALTAEANGVVTTDAKDAFARSVALDSTTVTAQFYLGIASEQDGKYGEAAKRFRDLIDHAPAGAHWVSDVKTALARVDGKPDGAPADKQAGGPPQDGSVRGMVDRLAARMRKDGSDPQGWVKLVQSYSVLDDAEKKQATIADARKALAGDSEKLAKFESGLAALEKGEPLPAEVAAAPHSPTNAAPADSAAEDPSVRGMVNRLADRLKKDGGDVDDWIKLIRSYKVIKDDAGKTGAANDARKALASDATKLAKLETAIKAIDAGEEPPAPEPPPAGAAQGGADHDADAMVRRLADRLKRSGGDPEGWLMLVRTYATLKQPEQQKTAVADARKALAGEPAKLDAFNDALKRFKLE